MKEKGAKPLRYFPNAPIKKDYVVFQGPLKDREGKERIAEGKKPDFDWLEKMDWFVEGVQGTTN